MPKHPDFQKIYDRFVEQYGKEEGERIYFAFLHNENLDDTKSMVSQKDNPVDVWYEGEFNQDHYDKYPTMLEYSRTENIDIPHERQCGCNDSSCDADHTDSHGSDIKYYKIKKEIVDAIPGNSVEVQKTMNDFIKTEKEKYNDIIDKWMERLYDEGVQTSANELNMEVAEFGNIRKKNQQVKILQENSKNLMFNMMDDINKEIGLFVTDVSLNNIPISNPELKKEIRDIFSKKEGRLNSQVTTETDRSFNTALEFGYKESGLVTHKQWVAIVDGRTTQICLALNGEIVELGKPFSLGDYSPPAHINCRSRIESITVSEKE